MIVGPYITIVCIDYCLDNCVFLSNKISVSLSKKIDGESAIEGLPISTHHKLFQILRFYNLIVSEKFREIINRGCHLSQTY